jgi:hypothetical protein
MLFWQATGVQDCTKSAYHTRFFDDFSGKIKVKYDGLWGITYNHLHGNQALQILEQSRRFEAWKKEGLLVR